MFGWHDMGGAGWLFMSAVMLAVLAVVVIAVLVGTRALQSRDQPPPAANARRILDERFARGEIDEDEYQQRREVLEHR